MLDSVGAVSMAGLLLCSMYPSTTVFALMLLLADPFRNWVNFVCLVLQCAGKSIWESIEMLVSFCLFSLYQLMQFACCLPVLLQLWYVRTSCKLHSGCSDCLVCSKTPNALMFRLYWMGRALIGFNKVFWNCIRSRCCDNSFFLRPIRTPGPQRLKGTCTISLSCAVMDNGLSLSSSSSSSGSQEPRIV